MEDEPAYDLSVACLTGDSIGCEAELLGAIQAALARHRRVAARINLALVDDARIAELHRRHLRQHGPTDVLAFDLRDGVHESAVDGEVIDGEIVISIETARRESQSRGHPLEAELALYAVHGTLHLLGYDDHDEAGARRMHQLEDEILESAGFGTVYRTSAS